MTKTLRSEAGFTLLEVLISTAIMLTVTGGIFMVMNPSGKMFQAQPEVVDMQQRLRIGVDTLTRDLVMAGAGAYSGSQTGTLTGFFSPILPSRQGNAPATFNGLTLDQGPGAYSSNSITIIFVPSTFSQTTISQGMPTSSAELKVNPEYGCPNGANLCGFQAGEQVLIYDDTGSFDTMTITQVQDNAGHLQHNQSGDLSKSYDSGAKIVQIQQHSYYLDPVSRQLMHWDGINNPVPLLDEVVGLNFEYYADPQPPAMKDGNGLSGKQDVTYGPPPPAMGVTKPSSGAYWPKGENCTIQMSGDGLTQIPRLATLGGVGTGLVKLTQAQLTDGPWCPDPNNSNRFDADLFRIKKIRVTLRLQTGNASLRRAVTGGADALFTNGGTATDGARVVGDQQIRFDVSPRNLNLTR